MTENEPLTIADLESLFERLERHRDRLDLLTEGMDDLDMSGRTLADHVESLELRIAALEASQ